MKTPEVEVTRNVSARLIGWESEGGGRIELLTDAGDLKLGEKLHAHVRTVTHGKQPVNFEFLRKQGLRTGGIVLLRKIAHEGKDIISAKSVETLISRESDGLPYVLHSAAVSILPPPPNTFMVNECLVAMMADAVRTKDVKDGLGKVLTALEQACQFGKGGLIFTGEEKGGDVREVVVGGEETKTAEEILAEFKVSCPKEFYVEARRSKSPWCMVPFFRGEIDPERSSKMSAQRVNHDFGDMDELSWLPTHVVLRLFADTWLVCDATPAVEALGDEPALLLDL